MVWGNRGWGANIDGRGSHDLLTCGRCQENGCDHKWNHCRDMSFIEGAKYLPKDDNATDDKKAVLRLQVVIDKS